MTDAEIIQERLDKYSALFDLYLDQGTPPSPPPNRSTICTHKKIQLGVRFSRTHYLGSLPLCSKHFFR